LEREAIEFIATMRIPIDMSVVAFVVTRGQCPWMVMNILQGGVSGSLIVSG
jgi:hypothetical protein